MYTIYYKRRTESGLTRYTVAREMGIPLSKWKEIEEGFIPLENEWVDKFNDVINRAKEIKFNRIGKMQKVKEAIKNGSLKERMIKQGYTMVGLSKHLDIGATCCNYVIAGKPQVSEDAMEQVYDYLMNPLNKNLNPTKRGRKNMKKEEVNEDTVQAVANAIVLQANEDNKPVEKIVNEIVDESKDNGFTGTKPNIDNEERIKKLEREKEILITQLMRYEKLIDKM